MLKAGKRSSARRASRGCVCALVALAFSCSGPKRQVDTTNARPPSDARATVPGTSLPVVGSYQCHWQHDQEDLSAPCEISKTGAQQRFSLALELADLKGSASTARYGFRFVGTLRSRSDGSEQAIEADFLHQGPGAFAAVLQLADGSLVKINLQKPSD